MGRAENLSGECRKGGRAESPPHGKGMKKPRKNNLDGWAQVRTWEGKRGGGVVERGPRAAVRDGAGHWVARHPLSGGPGGWGDASTRATRGSSARRSMPSTRASARDESNATYTIFSDSTAALHSARTDQLGLALALTRATIEVAGTLSAQG